MGRTLSGLLEVFIGELGHTKRAAGRCFCSGSSTALRYSDGYRSLVVRDGENARLLGTFTPLIGTATRCYGIAVAGGGGGRGGWGTKEFRKRVRAAVDFLLSRPSLFRVDDSHDENRCGNCFIYMKTSNPFISFKICKHG